MAGYGGYAQPMMAQPPGVMMARPAYGAVAPVGYAGYPPQGGVLPGGARPLYR